MLREFLGLTEGTEGIASLIFFSSSSAKAKQGTRQSESKIGADAVMAVTHEDPGRATLYAWLASHEYRQLATSSGERCLQQWLDDMQLCDPDEHWRMRIPDECSQAGICNPGDDLADRLAMISSPFKQMVYL